jgi:hypothetical protein
VEVVLVAFGFTGFSGLEDFLDLLVASGKDGLFSTGKFVSWVEVANRRVKAHGVVVFDKASTGRRASWRFKGTPGRIQSFLRDLCHSSSFSVALGVSGRGAHMGQTDDADKLLVRGQ